MKKILLLISVFFVMNSVPLLQAASVKDKEEIKTKTLLIEVKEMVCSFCVVGVEKSFNRIDSVEDIFVDLGGKIVVVSLKEGENMDESLARKTVKDAGYEVVDVSTSDKTAKDFREATRKR